MPRSLAVLLVFGLIGEATAAEFSRTTIDVGVVVGDVEKSAKFYTEVVGFQEVRGFSVPGQLCQNAGLTDGKGLDVRVFVLGEGKDATRIKLMQVPGAKNKKSDNRFIHSQLGFSYLTIMVADMNAALKRLEKGKVAPIAKGPVALPGDLFLTLVRDPDGNMIELVGPKK